MASRQQLPTEQSVEDLLKIIENNKEEDVAGVTDDVLSFILHFNIQSGDQLVLQNAMYELYCKWSQNPVSRVMFGVKTSKHFIKHTIGPRHYFKINTDSIRIQKETLKYIEKNKLDRTKYPSWQKHFKSFLDFYKIEKGNAWVPSYVLMHFYDKWCHNNKRKSLLSEISFFNFCKIHFESKRNTESRMMWFGINKEFVKVHLPKQKLIAMQQVREKKHAKKQKIKNKIPSTKTRIKSKNKIRTN